MTTQGNKYLQLFAYPILVALINYVVLVTTKYAHCNLQHTHLDFRSSRKSCSTILPFLNFHFTVHACQQFCIDSAYPTILGNMGIGDQIPSLIMWLSHVRCLLDLLKVQKSLTQFTFLAFMFCILLNAEPSRGFHLLRATTNLGQCFT
ncbi:hypothetical protein VNO78_01029 [Psophocarpus tetragonolobus]|uniref:Uncharacterized protein n=1 Tax=Psophocarpus tetragonolobus TaxID=3891 RepID=A0AAN9XU39_PSOTE